MMNELMAIAERKGIEVVKGYYCPTMKNGMVKEFYKQFGFNVDSEKDGKTVWSIRVNNYRRCEPHMLVQGE